MSVLQYQLHVNFVSSLFIAALRSPAGNRLTSWLSFVMFNFVFVTHSWNSGSGKVLDCIDS